MSSSADEPQPCRVPGCAYVARSNAHLRMHIAVHIDGPRFACAAAGCARTYKTAASLRRHERSPASHSRSKAVAECPTCGLEYKRMSTYLAHTTPACPFASAILGTCAEAAPEAALECEVL